MRWQGVDWKTAVGICARCLPPLLPLLSGSVVPDSVRPTDGSPPGSPVPGSLQARTLEWVPLPSPVHERKSESEVAQSCPTPSDPMDCSLLGSSAHFPGKSTGVGCHFLLQCMKGKVKVKSLSRVRLCATPWTAAHQAPPSMGFSRQEYWSGVPLPWVK